MSWQSSADTVVPDCDCLVDQDSELKFHWLVALVTTVVAVRLDCRQTSSRHALQMRTWDQEVARFTATHYVVCNCSRLIMHVLVFSHEAV